MEASLSFLVMVSKQNPNTCVCKIEDREERFCPGKDSTEVFLLFLFHLQDP